MKKHNNQYFLFDLDGTIVFTDTLNNESYNFALKMYKLDPITGVDRITRSTIIERYPNTDKLLLENIIQSKQDFFIKNIHRIKINTILLNFIEIVGENCILWTSSESKRAISIYNHLNLQKLFSGIFFSNKKNLQDDIAKICKKLHCKHNRLLIFENNHHIVRNLISHGVSCVLVSSPYKYIFYEPLPMASLP